MHLKDLCNLDKDPAFGQSWSSIKILFLAKRSREAENTSASHRKCILRSNACKSVCVGVCVWGLQIVTECKREKER